MPKTGAKERTPVDEKTRKLIFDTCLEHRMGVPALIMLYIGIRKGELLGLTWKDINLDTANLSVNKSAWFDNNRVAVKGPKSKAGYRTVPVLQVIIPILREFKARSESEYVCPST